MATMTKAQLIVQWKDIVSTRLGNILNATPQPEWAQTVLQQVISALQNGATGSTSGSCTYSVEGGSTTCVNGITDAECSLLGGTPSTKLCGS